METINSFKGYGKVDPVEEQAFRRKARKRLVILIVSVVLLVAVIIGVVTGILIHNHNNKDSGQNDPSSQLSSAQSIKAVCSEARYPESCYNSISELNTSNSTDPEELLKLSLQVVFNSLSDVSLLPQSLMNSTNEQKVKNALEVCKDVLNDAVEYLSDSISSMDVKSGEKLLSVTKIDDLKTWVSTALTNQETCLDALEEMNATFVENTRSKMKNSTEYASNSLAIVSKISGILGKLNLPTHRKLLSEEPGFPEWVSPRVRRLLQVERPKPNVTVALDGSGNVTTIKDAMAMVQKKSKTLFVIYIKAGEYKENVVLDKSFWNVMIYGDGKDQSIVSANLNFVDGTPTFSTATFAVAGKGFVAIDMGFKNTAGAAKHQAVAFRSGSDFSVFYRCSFDAFQDTLYPHSNRQFYRECDVTGTIDFIFGNAAVVFQNCKIMPRQPLSNQFVTITAQGKKDPNQNTGISIQKCTISAFDNLNASTYLGRPWKEFSTTVIMQSTIGSFMHPLGWISWVQGVDPPASIFYGEYLNTGPGAGVGGRVKWAGYKPSLTSNEASRFTVGSFIEGAVWLPQTNVIYESSL